MQSLPKRAGRIALAALLGVFIALFGQGIWSALVVANLASSATVPWAIPAMAAVLWLMWRYLDGAWWPQRTSAIRHRLLRARLLPRPVFGWALLAGAFAIVALAGLWIVLAQLSRMPGSVLPDLAGYPRWFVALLVAMGALVSPILEQAGFWGYFQVMLEDELDAPAVVMLVALLFALLPHPPLGAAFLPKFVFFFLTGATFGAIANLTDSILPSLAAHIGGLLTFFVLIWPNDPGRPLLRESGPDAWFWLHAAQTIAFTALALFAFRRLAQIRISSGNERSHHRHMSRCAPAGSRTRT